MSILTNEYHLTIRRDGQDIDPIDSVKDIKRMGGNPSCRARLNFEHFHDAQIKQHLLPKPFPLLNQVIFPDRALCSSPTRHRDHRAMHRGGGIRGQETDDRGKIRRRDPA